MSLGFTYNCYNQKNTRTYLTQVKKTKINLIKDRTRINQPHQQDKKVAPTVTSPTTSPITFGLRLEHHQPMCHLLLADSYMFGICWPCLATRLLEGKHKKTQSAPKQGSPLYYLPAPVILEADVPTFKTHSQRLIASSYEKALHSRDSASKRFQPIQEAQNETKVLYSTTLLFQDYIIHKLNECCKATLSNDNSLILIATVKKTQFV